MGVTAELLCEDCFSICCMCLICVRAVLHVSCADYPQLSKDILVNRFGVELRAWVSHGMNST